MYKEDINIFAKKSGYAKTEFIGKYLGKKVHAAYLESDEKIRCTGLPTLILEDKGEFELVHDYRSIEILGDIEDIEDIEKEE